MVHIWDNVLTDRQTDRQTEVNLPVFVLSAYRYSRGSSCPFQPDG